MKENRIVSGVMGSLLYFNRKALQGTKKNRVCLVVFCLVLIGLACPSSRGMLSSPGVVQLIEAQSYAGHPGSHHPGNHPLLLPGDRRPAIRTRSENRYTNHHCDDHVHTNLYLYANRFLDKDIDIHSDENANTNPDRQRLDHFYAHLDPIPFSHIHAKRNADTNANLDTVFHIYRHPIAAVPHHHTLI
jgi:hypothetical protein